jgi:hypothetical protein
MHRIKDLRFLVSTVVITLIIILSARSHMAMNEVRLNSDHAIHVLMTQDLVLPNDLYYWGQDRLGSIVPILAHGIMRVFSLSPVVAVSISQYFFLLLGFFAFASLIKNIGLRVVFALVWFLPLVAMTELLRISQPYGPQMAFVGWAVVFAQRLSESAPLKPSTRQGLIAAVTLSWFTSIWISDFSVLLAVIFAAVVLFSTYRQTASNPDLKGLARFNLTRLDLLNVGSLSLLSIAFILLAKSSAYSRRSYETFNSLSQTLAVVSSLWNSAFQTLTFRSNPALSPLEHVNFAGAIHAILVGVMVIYVSRIVWSLRRAATSSRWTVFFLISGIVSLAVLPWIHWIYNDGIVNLRYFTVVYVCFWAAAILFADGLWRSGFQISGLKDATVKQLGILLIGTALFASWTLPDRVFELKQPPSTIEKLQPLVSLGRVGFIGEYWASYTLCSVNPAQLTCISKDNRGKSPCPPTLVKRPIRKNGTRCIRCIPKVLAADTIYLVKEKWLSAFPPEIEQYRRCLTQVGEPRKVGEYTIAPYKVKS